MSLLRVKDAFQAKDSHYKNKGKMKYSAKITVSGDAEKLYRCILPEASKRDRTSLRIEKKEGMVHIEIVSKDAVAFRAATNSITQMLTIFEKTKNG